MFYLASVRKYLGEEMKRTALEKLLKRILIYSIAGIVFWFAGREACASSEVADPIYTDVQAYILEKLECNSLVFLGEVHKKSELIGTVAGLLPYLHNAGVTHIALEIPSDQQNAIDHYIESGDGFDGIKLHEQIDCPQYRNLFVLIRSLDPSRRAIPVAIDLPESQYHGHISRDEYMAKSLSNIFKSDPNAKILSILGNNHVLIKLEWMDQVVNPHKSIRGYLVDTCPGLKLFSIYQVEDKSAGRCDFFDKLHSEQGPVAVEMNRRFHGWHLWMSNMAIKPAEVDTLLNGIIVY
jgi:hypothetical protein